MEDEFNDVWPDAVSSRPSEKECWEAYERVREQLGESEGASDVGEYVSDEAFHVLCDGTFKDVIFPIPNYPHIRFETDFDKNDIRNYIMRIQESDLEYVDRVSLNPTTDDTLRLEEINDEDLDERIFAPDDTWPLVSSFSREVSSNWPGQKLVTMFSFVLQDDLESTDDWLPSSIDQRIDSLVDREEYEQYQDHFVMEVTADENSDGYALEFSVPPGNFQSKMETLETAVKLWKDDED